MIKYGPKQPTLAFFSFFCCTFRQYREWITENRKEGRGLPTPLFEKCPANGGNRTLDLWITKHVRNMCSLAVLQWQPCIFRLVWLISWESKFFKSSISGSENFSQINPLDLAAQCDQDSILDALIDYGMGKCQTPSPLDSHLPGRLFPNKAVVKWSKSHMDTNHWKYRTLNMTSMYLLQNTGTKHLIWNDEAMSHIICML